MSNGRIWILGTGAFGAKTLPQGLAEIIGGAETVYSHISEDPSEWLPPQLVGARFVSLLNCYSNNLNRIDNYLRAAQTVVDGASNPSDVVFYTYGSPTVFDRVVSLVRDMAAEREIPCTVVPAASSVDATLAYLGEDMAPGLQVCEARWLVGNRITLDPRLPTLLFQIGTFWTDGLASNDDLECARLRPLKDYLLTQYPSFNPAIFVRAPLYFGDPGYGRGVLLRDLDSGSADDLHGTSLFVPEVLGISRKSKVWWKNLFCTSPRVDTVAQA